MLSLLLLSIYFDFFIKYRNRAEGGGGSFYFFSLTLAQDVDRGFSWNRAGPPGALKSSWGISLSSIRGKKPISPRKILVERRDHVCPISWMSTSLAMFNYSGPVLVARVLLLRGKIWTGISRKIPQLHVQKFGHKRKIYEVVHGTLLEYWWKVEKLCNFVENLAGELLFLCKTWYNSSDMVWNA